MRFKWFLLVDRDGRVLTTAATLAALSSVDGDHVASFRRAVSTVCPVLHERIDASDLTVYTSRAEFDCEQPPLGAAVDIGDMGHKKDQPFFVIAPIQVPPPPATPHVVCFGSNWSRGSADADDANVS